MGLAAVPAAIFGLEALLAATEREDPGDRASASINRLHRYSEVLGWEPRPGRYVEDGRVITINARGYRGVEVEQAAHRRRVVLLGDSIAFGLEVGDDETYAALLEREAPELEVHNLAVQGYGPGQSLLRLEGLGLALDPDVVVLGFCAGNDFADAMLATFLYDGLHPKPFFTLERSRLSLHDGHLVLGARQRVAHWLAEESRLFRRVFARGEVATDAGDAWSKRRRRAQGDWGRAVRLTTRLIVEMQARAAKVGAGFLLVLHPDERGDTTARLERFRARLEEAGVAALDLREAYADRGLPLESLTSDGLGHLNPRGHAATARILAETLR